MDNKKILYIDMDGVLVDFDSEVKKIDAGTLKKYDGDICNIPGVFLKMEPMPGAIDAYKKLSKKFDTYILSTAPWDNSSAWSDKLQWVKNHLGETAYKRLIITCHKELNKGNYLIDDMNRNGAKGFEGELILFGSDKFLNWESVLKYLLKKS
ncbi:MAG: hypothetical protein Q8O66_00830 [bacterium]|nr:hypothetical protein [bacterium]